MLLLMLVVGVGNAGADTSTLTFTAACGGSGTADDGAQWTVTSDGTESNFDSNCGIHYGTNSAPVTYLQLATSDIPGTITQVVVNARDAQAKGTISVTVGGSAFTCSGLATATNASADYTFTGNGSGEIVVKVDRGESLTKAIYVKSVAVTYQNAGTQDGTIIDIITSNDYAKNNSYADFTITKSSGAEFKGNAANPTTGDRMQFNSNSPNGITVTKSIGTVRRIVINWNTNTTKDRVVDIYGSNTAYSGPADLYDTTKRGTIIGSFKYDGKTLEASLNIEGNYSFVGIRSNKSALYLNSIKIEWEKASESSVATPTFSVPAGTYFEAQSVELTCETDGATIYYTLDGSDPTSESTPYTDPITISETTILKAIAIKGDDASAIATAEYKIVVTTGKGTEENPFTVADAIKVLDAGITPTNVYVAGTVSKVKGYYNSKYISYTITDGDNELDVYNGLNNGGEAFNSESDIQVRDQVIVKGNLIDYNGTKEFAANNQLVSLVRPEKPDPDLAFSAEAVLVKRGEAFTAPVLANPHNLIVEYESSNEAVATVAEDGSLTLLKAGETTITASFAGNADYKAGEASYTLTVTVPSHTATFFVNGQQQGEPVTIAEDETITFPTVVEELYGKQFVGWTTEAIDYAGDKPATLVNAATMGTADVTYYAVFANMISGSSASLTKMTSSDTFGAGDKVVIVADENVAMYQETVNKTYVNKYTFVNDVSKVAADDKNWFSVSAGSSDGTWKLGDETNGYVYTSGSNNLSIDSDNSTDFTLTWNSDTKKFTLVGNGRWLSYRSDLDNKYFRMGGAISGDPSGDAYFDIYKYISETVTYSDYCTTVVAPVKPAKPIVFHDDGGEYEGELTVAIAGEGVKYTLNDGAEETYSAPFTISDEGEYTIKAWAEKDGVKSDVVEKTFTIVEKTYDGDTFDGYYTIKNNGNNMFVNVAGRKTVTFESETADKAGTVIRVKTNDKGQVEVLRSQGVDLPRYAEKAMNYVPELAKALVERLGENDVIGEDGVNLIANEFKNKFDYHLYLEKADGGYRIYGKTPSMKHVVDFYANNKEIIDSRLPKVEGFVEEILLKVAKQLGHENSPWASKFKIHDIWKQMVKTNPDLTEPVEDNEAAISQFYTEILSSEANVWNFAHETMMIYWEKVMQYIGDNFNGLGDYGKYLEKVPNILPNFKYYIVSNKEGNGIDFISEGNEDIIKDAERTVWTLEGRENFKVTFDVVHEGTIYSTVANQTEPYTEYLTTLYTDFAYDLPEDGNVKAYKISSIDETTGVAKKEEITGTIPAQTPVLLISTAENATLKLNTVDGTAIESELKGADYFINKYNITSTTAEGILNALKSLSESLYNDYVYLQLKNSGTVNNKYFFGLDAADIEKCSVKNDNDELDCVIRNLYNDEQLLGFFNTEQALANKAFLESSLNPVKLFLIGDVNRDGKVSIADVTALVNIILGKAKYPDDADKYDFEAANVNLDNKISIADVTALVNIILGK